MSAPDVTLQLRVALHYLSRASASCRNGDPQREGPLHWPVAVDAARRALTAALGELDSAEAGMAWWNALAPDERSEWMERARSACPADAWRAYRRAREQEQHP